MSIARNSLYSALGSGIPVIVTIVTLPLLIGQIGLERYGVLAIAWLILVYVGQADFGLARAVTQKIASGERAQVPGVVATGFALSLGIGLVTALVAAILAHVFFAHVMGMPDALRQEILSAIWMIGAATLCVALFAMAIGCLSGEERFGEVSLHVLFTNSALQVLPLLAAFVIGPDLWTLLAATLLARVLGLLLAGRSVWRQMVHGNDAKPSTALARDMLHYGKWIMVSTIARPAMSMADRFFIGASLGAVAVAAYSVPYQIASRTQLVPQAVIRVLFPRFSSLDGAVALDTARKAVVVLANLSAPAMLVLICLADPLLRLWLGGDLDERSILLARILLAAFWLSGVSVLAATFIQARGEPRFTAAWHVVQLPLYAAALFLIAPLYGLSGFALVFLGKTIIDSGVLLAKAGLLTPAILYRLAFACCAVASAVLLHPVLTGWPVSLAAAAVWGGASLVAAYFTIPAEYRTKLFTLLRA